MKLNTKIILSSLVLSFGLISCQSKESKNLTVPENGLDPRINNFFNAVGLPLEELNADNPDAVQEDLSRVAKLFVNDMSGEKSLTKDGALVEDASSRPFFSLAKNVGAYFASQMWKTQITSTEDVKFFSLSQDVNDTHSNIKYKSDMFNLPAVFLNPYGNKTDPKNYLGSIMQGKYGKLNPQTHEFFPLSQFFIMEYKLRNGTGAKSGEGVRTYHALVSVPVQLLQPNNTKQARLVMYSHAGDFGTSASDLVTQLNTKLSEFVVVAPVFPGEPLCTQMSIQTMGCMRLDAENNLVPDNFGKFNNPYAPEIAFNSILPIKYPRSPLDEDINALLGAHNAVSRVMVTPLKTENPIYNVSTQKSLLLPLQHPEELINPFQDLNSEYSGARMVPTNMAPQTIGLAASRGGGVLLAAIGRMGFFMNGASYDTQFPHSVDDNGTSFEFQYPLFNTAAALYSPVSILTGKLRLMTIMVMKNDIESIAAIPMVTDLVKNKYFANYRNDPTPFTNIQKVTVLEDGSLAPATDSLTQLATFIASNDITFLAPFVSSGLQNWNSYYFEDNIRAPGSLVLLHGSQDMIVPMTESTIAATALNTIWAGLYYTPMDPYGNYLSSHKFAALHPMLKGSFIPGVGVAQYTFQPSNEFFNIPCNFEDLAGVQQPDVIYNSDVKRCFGGGYSPKADGKNAVGNFYGHSDASFYTGNLVNTIDPDLLHIAGLSSNVYSSDQITYNFGFDADRQMRFGGPKYNGVGSSTECVPGAGDCRFPYTVPLNSPTFMRYMSEEGKLSPNIVHEKKYIFAGDFKPNLTSKIKPHNVLFSWLESVACDWCEIGNANDEPLFPSHFGVFHDFKVTEPE